MKIIGRKEERKTMQAIQRDKKAHMLAIIGRRRVGKTFLIREVYKNEKVFEMTGLKDANLHDQLMNFTIQMNLYFPAEKPYTKPESWLMAFSELSVAISKSTLKKPVVFLDELPWIASKRSGFMEALAHWWNNWASQQNIIVVVCGSAASWMLQHVVNAKGGLHNRITKLITLMPFTLNETEAFLKEKNIVMSHYQIIQLYLALGGIPHYLDQVEKGKSAAQNINNLCFKKDGFLTTEFNNLYPALFDNAGSHIKIVKALASKASGLNRQRILKLTKLSDGGYFTNILNELEASGFISTFEPLEKSKKDTLFRLTDEYSLFYLSFMVGQNKLNKSDWLRVSETQPYKIWCGYAFENLCIKHIESIKEALGILGVETKVNSFLHRKDVNYPKGFQIDMLIDRKDNIINICEMKLYADEFAITKDYAQKLRTKREGLKTVTKSKKMVHITFISAYGVLENTHKMDLVENDFTTSIFFDS
ncbi:ATP-binding protein [Lacinutrix sp. 5H-3-7-4]|uniref:AAA family ATPase n=1 Tax=Lacinutrix sp. (strain 5H-3-7-4) TaxID=983544 RepID=UPI00020A3E46|nr:ATP-binding protein [Lacinutrix sp. 5H-3-7-4]AEH01881.1 ATPase [Lacinutrix sp. 5H-3-7-4]